MRTMFLAAATVAALSGSTTYTLEAKTTAPAHAAQTRSASQAPAGLPAYLMRPDGLMINGLLPNQGWQD
jgi:hypothetical protein